MSKRPASPLAEEEKQVEKKAKTTVGSNKYVTIRQKGSDWSFCLDRSALIDASDFFKAALEDATVETIELEPRTCTYNELRDVTCFYGGLCGNLGQTLELSWEKDSDPAIVFRLMKLMDFLSLKQYLELHEMCIEEELKKTTNTKLVLLACDYAIARKKRDWLELIAATVAVDVVFTPEQCAALQPFWMKRSRTLATIEKLRLAYGLSSDRFTREFDIALKPTT